MFGHPRSGKGDPAMQVKAIELAKQTDVVLLYISLDEISESEGLDRAHMRLPQSQVDLIEAVIAVNPNVVAVMSAGSAVGMPWLPKVKALITNAALRNTLQSIVTAVVTGGMAMVIIFAVDNKIFAPGFGEKE